MLAEVAALSAAPRSASHAEPGSANAHRTPLLAASNTIAKCRLARALRAVRTAENFPRRFHAVADDPTSTMRTLRSQRVDGAFEAIEDVTLILHDNLEGLVVRVAADFTLGC
jgi:hypothetical protein